MKIKYALPVVLCAAISGCATTPPPPPLCSVPAGVAKKVDDKHTVLGISLGQPLAIAECQKSYSPGNSVSYDSLNRKGVCYEERTYPLAASCSNLNDVTATIKYPPSSPNQNPAWAWNVYAHFVNGRVERVSISTPGVSGQDLAYADLVSKYGEPTEKSVSQVQNMNGAKFESITALWDAGDVFIEFDGTSSKLTSGEVRIYSAVGKAATDAKRKAYNESKQSL